MILFGFFYNLLSHQGSTKSSSDQRLLRYQNLMAQLFGKSFKKASIFTTSPCHNHCFFHLYPINHSNDPVCQGIMNSCKQVRNGYTSCQTGSYLLLGPYGADVTYFCRLLALGS